MHIYTYLFIRYYKANTHIHIYRRMELRTRHAKWNAKDYVKIKAKHTEGAECKSIICTDICMYVSAESVEYFLCYTLAQNLLSSYIRMHILTYTYVFLTFQHYYLLDLRNVQFWRWCSKEHSSSQTKIKRLALQVKIFDLIHFTLSLLCTYI